ncbi:MAG: hydroxyacylglutathione hydrolase [Acidobacteriota bacterium]|jgi:glyoxylase-like metal-dependent hydrolase (beta-lactamase superfamily II)/rhodanese-related sulfurtransferase|nr:hydroxyacylglutathione hydrolase [Acidobacteriota bacterium]
MYFKQFYLSCLAHASYLIGSEGEAAVVDPQRDVDQYVAEAAAEGLKIKYVVETHLHADFVSGHRELAARTGAEIVFGARAGASFPHRAVKDGDELRVGGVIIRVLETPGHTPESISLVVSDAEESGEPQKVLTGDTLFVGDVGRPDLAGARGFTPQQMAGMMYESLHGKLLKLGDEVEVWPAHGAGSMCGRNISKETSSTIGQQRRFNYALAPMERDEFVRLLTTDLPEAPAYFPADARINREGAPPLAEMHRPAALLPQQVVAYANLGYAVLDVRTAVEFGAGHIHGALNIGLGGQFASWAGALISLGTPLIVVASDESQVDETVMRLARVGHDSVRGYLRGGMEAWREAGFEVSLVEQVSVADLRRMLEEGEDLQVLDVRRAAEFNAGHAPRASNTPLSPRLREEAARLDRERPLAVICAGGYRSSAATSLLRPLGFRHLYNVEGGTGAWVAAGYPVEKPAAAI